MKLNDITGQIVGRLTVVNRDTTANKTKWNCICDCGNSKSVMAYNLMSGHTQSCGCFNLERTSEANGTHRMTGTPEYIVWCRMKQRCFDKGSQDFHNYGGRGITVYHDWLSFECFFADMGKRPTSSHTIERRDNDAGYSPDNCYWATRKEQNRNTRANRFITCRGETLCLSEWTERVGASRCLITNRLKRGWCAEDAIFKPARKIQLATST